VALPPAGMRGLIWQDQRSASLFQWLCLRRPIFLCFAKETLDKERRPGYSPGPRKRGFYGGQASGAYRDVSQERGRMKCEAFPTPKNCTSISVIPFVSANFADVRRTYPPQPAIGESRGCNPLVAFLYPTFLWRPKKGWPPEAKLVFSEAH